MEKGRIAQLRLYKDRKYYGGRIRWLLMDKEGNSVYCDRCGNIANGVMRVERDSGVYNVPLCKKHIGDQFPWVESCPCYVLYERPKKAGLTEQEKAMKMMVSMQV